MKEGQRDRGTKTERKRDSDREKRERGTLKERKRDSDREKEGQ